MSELLQTALVSARASVRQRDEVVFYTRSLQLSVGVPMTFDAQAPLASAMEFALAAVAADVLGGFARLADRARLVIDAAEAVINAEVASPLAYIGVVGETGQPRLSRLTMLAYLDTGEARSDLQPVWDEALRRAPFINTLRPSVDLDLDFRITG